MKIFDKKVCLLFTLLFVVSLLEAQDKTFRAGMLGGLNVSQIRGDGNEGFNKVGFVGGVFVQTTTSPHFTYQFELLFSQKGSRKYPNPDSLNNSNLSAYRIALSYIEVPLLVNYKLNHFHFIGGPSFGVLLSSKEEDFFSEITNNQPFRRLELSMNLGAEWEFSEKFYLEARYNFSLLPIRTGSQGFRIWYNGGVQYNHVLLLMGRYLF
jgi:Outer membrane protein beta-barrel domain